MSSTTLDGNLESQVPGAKVEFIMNWNNWSSQVMTAQRCWTGRHELVGDVFEDRTSTAVADPLFIASASGTDMTAARHAGATAKRAERHRGGVLLFLDHHYRTRLGIVDGYDRLIKQRHRLRSRWRYRVWFLPELP